MRSRMYATILVVLASVTSLIAAGPNCSVGTASYSTIQAALDDPTCSVISVPAGTHPQNVVILRSVEINGAGAATTILDGGGANRVIDFGGAELRLRNLTLRNGAANGDGGAIRNTSGRLFLENVVITGNSATGSGGGIALLTVTMPATANIVDSTISSNNAASGGGISMAGWGGTLEMRRSLVAGNESRGDSGPGGGGLLLIEMNDALISNSTISGNRSNTDGGGISSIDFPNIQLTNVTITNNSSATIGGVGVVFMFSTRNSIISGNFVNGTTTPSDCSGSPDAPTMMSFGSNVFGSNGSAGNCPATGMDRVPFGDTSSVIGALADNGGPTLTHLLADGSLARDAGADIDTQGTDQRGFSRLRGAHVDIGAVEMGTPPTSDAAGPYSVNEGNSVNVSGIGTPYPDEQGALTLAWDLDRDGSFETSGATVTFSAATLDGPSTHTIAFRVCDAEGECATDTATVDVLNVAPRVTLSGASINEGATATVNGTVTDVSSDSINVVISWGTGLGTTTISLPAGATSFSASKSFVDDGTFSVSATATDDDGGSDSASANVVVANLAPVVTAGSNLSANVGVSVNATATFTDAGAVDTHTATVNWGDGSGTQAANVSGGSVSASHSYSSAGTFSVSICVADNRGASNCASLSATITAPTPVPPPPPPDPGTPTGKITGGGLKTAKNGRGGFNIDGLKGELQFQNDAIKLHASKFTSLSIAPDRKSARFAGVSDSGVDFYVYVEDNDNGDSDVFKLWTGAPADAGGTLQTGDGRLKGGNIQIHK